jgi:hypothetical protein
MEAVVLRGEPDEKAAGKTDGPLLDYRELFDFVGQV